MVLGRAKVRTTALPVSCIHDYSRPCPMDVDTSEIRGTVLRLDAAEFAGLQSRL